MTTGNEPVPRWEFELRERDVRIKELERGVEALKPKGASAREWIGLILPFVQALGLGLFAYLATDSVSSAIRKQELQLSNVTEMRELLLDLSMADSLQRARADAITLSAFGEHAVQPLIVAVQGAGEYQAIAAEEGLRAIGMHDTAAVCRSMANILRNRSQLYTWNAHLVAVRTIRLLDYRPALSLLESYQAMLGTSGPKESLPILKAIVALEPEPTGAVVTDLKAELVTSIEALKAPRLP